MYLYFCDIYHLFLCFVKECDKQITFNEWMKDIIGSKLGFSLCLLHYFLSPACDLYMSLSMIHVAF